MELSHFAGFSSDFIRLMFSSGYGVISIFGNCFTVTGFFLYGRLASS